MFCGDMRGFPKPGNIVCYEDEMLNIWMAKIMDNKQNKQDESKGCRKEKGLVKRTLDMRIMIMLIMIVVIM